MTAEEKKVAKREYEKQWRRKNPDKIRAIRERFYLKKAAEIAARISEKEAEV